MFILRSKTQPWSPLSAMAVALLASILLSTSTTTWWAISLNIYLIVILSNILLFPGFLLYLWYCTHQFNIEKLFRWITFSTTPAGSQDLTTGRHVSTFPKLFWRFQKFSSSTSTSDYLYLLRTPYLLNQDDSCTPSGGSLLPAPCLKLLPTRRLSSWWPRYKMRGGGNLTMPLGVVRATGYDRMWVWPNYHNLWPASFTALGWALQHFFLKRYVLGHLGDSWAAHVVPVPPSPYANVASAMIPDGGLHCNLDSWQRYLAAHLSMDEDFLPKDMWTYIHTPITQDFYGFGWMIDNSNDESGEFSLFCFLHPKWDAHQELFSNTVALTVTILPRPSSSPGNFQI